MKLMLLAAGEGTRLRPYTAVLPKPAIPFLNVPLAAHAMNFLGDLEIDHLVVNTFYLPEDIHRLFHILPHGARQLSYSDEVAQILGSGGGLGKARNHFLIEDAFFMMNADEVVLPHDADIAKKALAQHIQNGNLATIMVMDHPGVGTEFGGVWTDGDNNVLGFGKTPIPGAVKAWHFVGAQVLSKEVFQYIPEVGESNILYDALTAGIREGLRVEAFPFDCTWFETGNPASFLEATEKCLKYLSAPNDSYQKITLQRALRRFVGEPCKLVNKDSAVILAANSASIPNSGISGFLCAGPGAQIPEGCQLRNVVVGKNYQLPEGTRAQNTVFISKDSL